MAPIVVPKRLILRWVTFLLLISMLAACAPQTVEVTKEVVVTKEIIKEVTKEVPKELIITQEVPVEKLVTPTPVAFKNGGKLVIGLPGDTKTLDPHVSQLWVWQNIRFQIFERLFELDSAGNTQPWLATGYKWVDPKTLDVTLRDDVTFHNGEKFTAEDVKYTIDRIFTPDLPSEFQGYLASIDNVEVVDPKTVRFHLKESDATLPFSLTRLDIISKSVKPEDIATKPIGTGPFKFAEWSPNEQLRLVRNENYWQPGLPYLDEVVYKPIPDSEARIASLLSGDIDVDFEVAAKDVARLATTPKVNVQLSKPNGLSIFYINTRKPPFDNPKVRQALLYAFDRQNYNRDFLAGLSRVSNVPVAPENWAYNKDADAMYPYDPEKAKSLLAEAGYTDKNPLKLEIIYPVGLEEYKTVSEYLQASLTKAGINAKVTGMELAAWSNKIIKEKSYDIAFDMRDMFADPALSYDDFTFFKPDPGNFDGFVEESIPGYLDLVKQGKQETDQAKRAEIYKKLQQLWADNLPGWIVTQNPGSLVSNDLVKNYEIVAGRPAHLWKVWLDK